MEHEQYQKEYCNFQDQFSRPLHRLHREIGDFLMVTDEPVHAVEVLAEEAQKYICKEKPEDQMPENGIFISTPITYCIINQRK